MRYFRSEITNDQGPGDHREWIMVENDEKKV